MNNSIGPVVVPWVCTTWLARWHTIHLKARKVYYIVIFVPILSKIFLKRRSYLLIGSIHEPMKSSYQIRYTELKTKFEKKNSPKRGGNKFGDERFCDWFEEFPIENNELYWYFTIHRSQRQSKQTYLKEAEWSQNLNNSIKTLLRRTFHDNFIKGNCCFIFCNISMINQNLFSQSMLINLQTLKKGNYSTKESVFDK